MEPSLVKNICQNWHSRVRGVANLEHMIPMLGGKLFVLIPVLGGSANFVFVQHLCGDNAITLGFLTISKGYC